VAGGFGELCVPTVLIVSGDATATANNVIASDLLFRMGFASYLVEAISDIALSLILYVLLRPVGKELALLAVFFRVVGTAIFAVSETFYFAASFFLGGADYLKTFSPDQLNTLAYVTLRTYVYGGGLFFVFGGVGSILLGYLIFRSGYLPKLLGALVAVGGVGFVIRSFALALASASAALGVFLLLPTGLAMLSLALWLLVQGHRRAEMGRESRGRRVGSGGEHDLECVERSCQEPAYCGPQNDTVDQSAEPASGLVRDRKTEPEPFALGCERPLVMRVRQTLLSACVRERSVRVDPLEREVNASVATEDLRGQ
jgi:hypothetical protein